MTGAAMSQTVLSPHGMDVFNRMATAVQSVRVGGSAFCDMGVALSHRAGRTRPGTPPAGTSVVRPA